MKFGIIADDYTGANDVGAQFAKKGLKTIVLIQASMIRDVIDKADVVVIDTESRIEDIELAYKRVFIAAKALKEGGIDTIYKKIDSTLRGNIGIELDAVMDALHASAIVVSPAFPKNGRITVGGYHLLHQIPLEHTEFARDPRFPMKESHVPTLIQKQSRRRVGHINLSEVLKGVKNLRKQILTQIGDGIQIMVVDATTQNDLKTITKAIFNSNLSRLVCGSAGLAEEVPEALGLVKKSVGAIVVVAGSVSNVTIEQISEAANSLGASIVDLNPLELASSEEKKRLEVARVVKEATGILDKGGDVIVRWASSPEFVAELRHYLRGSSLSDNEIISRVLDALGEVTASLSKHKKVIGLVLTGGETAINACNAMGVLWTEIEGEVLSGIPIVKLFGGKSDGMRVVTKAGAFGDKCAIVEVIKYLKKTC